MNPCGRINFYCPACSVSGEVEADTINYITPGGVFRHRCHHCETEWEITMTFKEEA